MYQYHCLNSISDVGLNRFTEEYKQTEKQEEADALLVRSAGMHDMEFSKRVKVIARAGAGVNNIPLERCAEEGIVVLNTPGANANGVKELVLAGLFLGARDIVDGIQWVREHKEEETLNTLAEKNKKKFAGQEIQGKKLGVIGLGAIGVLVANAAIHLGMDVYGYDPYLSVDGAWKLSRNVHHAGKIEELYEACDYITIHVPATEATKGMIGRDDIYAMKDQVVILNFARDVIVDEGAMKEALESGKVKHYITDFPNAMIAGVEGTIVIPHLGASTEESEENCARMAVMEVIDFLENGNIKNSVNYPDCDMGPYISGTRITILHRNVPNMIGQFTALLAEENVNITNMTNKSRGGYAYTMIDTNTQISKEMIQKLNNIHEILNVRILA